MLNSKDRSLNTKIDQSPPALYLQTLIADIILHSVSVIITNVDEISNYRKTIELPSEVYASRA